VLDGFGATITTDQRYLHFCGLITLSNQNKMNSTHRVWKTAFLGKDAARLLKFSKQGSLDLLNVFDIL
jgi:hypothetical protein